MTDSLLPLAGRCYTGSTTTSARAKNKKGPKPREHIQLFCMKRDCNRASTLKSANWRHPSHCALIGLGTLCLGMCDCRFTLLSRAPNGVSNEHSCSDRNF